MRKIHCMGLLALAFAFDAAAQDPPCPSLPGNSNLHWEHRTGDGFSLCRALDGERQVLGVMLTSEPTKLLRRNREEEGRVGSHPVHWYLPNVADADAARKRITVIELGDDRYAQVWVDASSDAELQQLLTLAQGIALR